jgi:benzoyl-CoA reductase/2-hydroxyglutaryl-CoA dehydratase subunit BcrC/BadD/HgdB
MPEDMKKHVIYSCPFIPAEWIAAHGLTPKRVIPDAAMEIELAGQGMCPYTRAFLRAGQQDSGAAAVLFTTACDQMRRGSELLNHDAPMFLFNVPTTWETVTAQKMYASELRRLSRFLERLGGSPLSSKELAEIMASYDHARAELKAARGRLCPRDYSRALADFHETGRVDWTRYKDAPIRSGVPLALVGGPMLANHFDLFDTIEEAGGRVVLDATTTGERTLPDAFDRRRMRDDPFTVLLDAYFGTIPDAFRRPNSLLYAWLKNKFQERGVKGIVFRQYTWCDTWRGEAQRMKEWAGLPFLALDTGDDPITLQRTSTRIESFMEVLR